MGFLSVLVLGIGIVKRYPKVLVLVLGIVKGILKVLGIGIGFKFLVLSISDVKYDMGQSNTFQCILFQVIFPGFYYTTLRSTVMTTTRRHVLHLSSIAAAVEASGVQSHGTTSRRKISI